MWTVCDIWNRKQSHSISQQWLSEFRESDLPTFIAGDESQPFPRHLRWLRHRQAHHQTVAARLQENNHRMESRRYSSGKLDYFVTKRNNFLESSKNLFLIAQMLFLFLSVKLNNFFSSGLNGVEEHHHCTGFRAGTGSRAIPDRENGEHP